MRKQIDFLIKRSLVKDVLYVHITKFREACEVLECEIKVFPDGTKKWWSKSYKLELKALANAADGTYIDQFLNMN
jgi:hypothetical protein